MYEWVWMPLTVVVTFASVVAAFFMLRRRLDISVENLQIFVKDGLETYQDTLNKQLKPILDNNSRVMGIIGSLGAESKKLQAAEKVIGEAIIDEEGVVLDGVRAIFPQVADYLEERPELIVKLMPKLKEMAGSYGLLDVSQQEGGSLLVGRPHPFGFNER